MLLRGVERLIAQLESTKQSLLGNPHWEAAELNVLERDIFSLKVALDIIRRYVPERVHPRRGVIDPESNIGCALRVLRDAGAPLHIDEILRRMKRLHGRAVGKNSLTSRLSKMAKAGRVFTLLRPGTYGVIEERKR